jgi:hypothetical protein
LIFLEYFFTKFCVEKFKKVFAGKGVECIFAVRKTGGTVLQNVGTG